MAATKKTATSTEAFETLTTLNPDAFKEGYDKFAEGVSTIADFQKGAFDALIASAGAFTKGVEKLTAEQTAFVKSAFEDTVANTKAATSSKNAQDAFDQNSEFVRTAFEKNLGQANKIADLWTETTKETVEPLTARYGELVEKIQAYRP